VSIMRRVAATVAACLVASAAAAAGDPAARMDEVVQSYVKSKDNPFIGAVLVERSGQALLSKGYGSANLEWDVPNTPTTKFRLGSVTKQFTAAAILLLEDRGKLRVDDLVKKHLPDAPPAWDKVTIFHLLTHTSGIPSFTAFPDYGSLQSLPTFPKELVRRFRDKPLDFEPGEMWSYSNSGYVLLGYLIEKISGESYDDFLRKNVFEPLEMKDSGYDSPAAIIPRRASGYSPGRKGSPVNTRFLHMTVPHAAGGLYSTTEDLGRWVHGLFGAKLLSAASLQKMITPFKQDYALGLAVSTVRGHKKIEHGGGIEGFNTHLAYYPDDQLIVAVLGNLNGGAPYDIAGKLAALALGEEVVLPSERKEVSVPPEVLAAYVGTYDITPTFSIVVTLEGGQLMAQGSGQPKLPIFAVAENRFFLKAVDAELEFVKGDKGEVTHLLLRQGPGEAKGVRK
jgi:CubicO group peptidase (beta-lactamase class C family)